MPISNNNEITVRAICEFNVLNKELLNEGFKETNKYKFTDIFLIPDTIETNKSSPRDILKHAILLREANGITTNRNSKKITFKEKRIDENGDILFQSSIKCSIDSIEDAKKIFFAIGYKELMKLDAIHTVYEKNDLRLVTKDVVNGSLLIEVETDNIHKDINELKDILSNLKISIDLSNFFVKKTEEELQKIIDEENANG